MPITITGEVRSVTPLDAGQIAVVIDLGGQLCALRFDVWDDHVKPGDAIHVTIERIETLRDATLISVGVGPENPANPGSKIAALPPGTEVAAGFVVAGSPTPADAAETRVALNREAIESGTVERDPHVDPESVLEGSLVAQHVDVVPAAEADTETFPGGITVEQLARFDELLVAYKNAAPDTDWLVAIERRCTEMYECAVAELDVDNAETFLARITASLNQLEAETPAA